MICKLTIAYKRHYKYSCSASTNVWHKVNRTSSHISLFTIGMTVARIEKNYLYSTTIIRDSVTRRYSLKSKSYFINGRNKRIHYFHCEFAHMLVEEDNTSFNIEVRNLSVCYTNDCLKKKMTKQRYSTRSVFVYKHDFTRIWKHFFTACLVSRRRL